MGGDCRRSIFIDLPRRELLFAEKLYLVNTLLDSPDPGDGFAVALVRLLLTFN
jgi:hypothetical protein